MRVDGKRWQQIQDIFYAALDMEAEKRPAFLDEACSGDSLLRQEVDSLLESHEEAESFLASPAVQVAARVMADDQAELAMGNQIGPYKMLTKIGRGGMGEVYLAEDTRLGRKVALKFLPPYFTTDKDRLRRFQQEARAASALNHPNIITIFEIGQDGPIHFIATEYIQGETLRQRISREKINISEALDITTQIANALSAAHEAGIAHRDIKPENVMLRPDGYVKVLDFGLAKLTERQNTPSTSDSTVINMSTEPGRVMGTVNYMSPEQARGLRVDARTDIFSLGIVLYEMVAGRLPFEGETGSDVIAAILKQEPSPLVRYSREVPQPVEWVVAKILTKDREGRYQTAKELLTDLKRLKKQLEFEGEQERSQSGAQAEPAMRAGQITRDIQAIYTGDKAVTRTEGRAPTQAPPSAELASPIKRRKTVSALALVAMAVLVAAIAFGIYKLAGRNQPETRVMEPFSKMRVARLTSIGNVAGAAISPDGKYVVYVTDDAGKQSLWLRQAATTSNVQIVPPSEGQSYRALTFSSDGNYIFYLRRERSEPRAALYQMPVLGGEPKKLIADVSVQDTSSNISFSPDGKQIALIRLDENFERTLVIINADGTAERKLASRTLPGYLAGAAWSPDGKIIACLDGSFAGGGGFDGGYKRFVAVRVEDGIENPIFQQKWGAVGAFAWLSDSSGLIISAIEKAGLPQLWRISYPGGEVRRITNDLNGYTGVSLTADSKALVTTQGERPANIWIAPAADASRAKKITSASGDYNQVCSMPDGRIVYQSVASGNSDIWIMNADGTGQKQLTAEAGSNSFPSVTPDGRYIVFSSDRSGKLGVWRMDSDGGNPKLLANGGSVAHCSPDSKWVIYYQHSPEGAHLWKVPIEGGDPAQLTFKNVTARPAISPDGKLIACNYLVQQPNSHFCIAILPFEGGEPVKVFDTPTFPPREIRWTPDGRAFCYIETRAGVSNVWSQPIEGGPAKQLTGFKSDFMFSFDWLRDGRLVCSRGTPTSDAVLISDFK